jgi:hypothetical protein
MLIVTILSLTVAAYFIYERYKNTKLIADLRARLEEELRKNA